MTTLIKKPGCYDLPAEAYHADPCHKPSFSRSFGHMLLTGTPRRAFLSHPRLNPAYQPEQKKIFDFGSVAHALMLRDRAEIQEVRSKNYKGFAAQRARTMAYESGQIPILSDDLDRAKAMVKAGRAQLAEHDEAAGAFLEGDPEQTLIWKEKIDGVTIYCRARLDWKPPFGGMLDDYKTTNLVGGPESWCARVMYPEGGDLQAALYSRGYEKVFGTPPAGFRFIVQCTEPPFELFTVRLSNGDFALATSEVEHALGLFAWCMKRNKWPGYPAKDYIATRSIWREKAVLDREDREEAARAAGQDIREKLIDWQSPFEKNMSKGRKAA